MIVLPKNLSSIITVPISTNKENKDENDDAPIMDALQQQLQDITFHYLHKGNQLKNGTEIISKCVTELKIGNANSIVMVSDKDQYIKAAKDVGMVTIRVCPPNSRRGNVSAHYTVQTVPETQDIINQINGISFNTVLNK